MKKYLFLLIIVLGFQTIFASSSAVKIDRYVKKMYRDLKLRGKVSIDALKKALIAYNNTLLTKPYINRRLLTIIDYSKPSYKKRLFVIDLKSKKIILSSLVAHGKRSGGYRKPIYFSNHIGSEKTSLGGDITTKTYRGRHGESLKLKGLEKRFNANALKRKIVIHGAPYVNSQLVRMKGRIGRSQGCPAVPMRVAKKLIRKIKNGSFVFIYGNSKRYAKKSKLLAKRKWILG